MLRTTWSCPRVPIYAVVVAPATFNTVNKWAAGITDTFATGLLCELTGLGVPILAVPLVKDALARIDEKGPSAVVAAPASGAAKAAPKGPSAREVAAAAQLAPAERNGMIEGMVARLAQKMAENGADVEGWLRLIKAYSVLGERDKALAAAANARSALAGNSDNLRRIGELAKELGLEGS
jgi:Flavoprotein.